MGLLSNVTERWAFLPTRESSLPACPECGAEMEQDYVHDPAFQDHWRGSPAWVCAQCGYAERREG